MIGATVPVVPLTANTTAREAAETTNQRNTTLVTRLELFRKNWASYKRGLFALMLVNERLFKFTRPLAVKAKGVLLNQSRDRKVLVSEVPSAYCMMHWLVTVPLAVALKKERPV